MKESFMDMFKTALPLSMQVAAILKEKIKNKELKPGERLQSVRKLAAELSVGRQVIVSAFDMLAKEKILKKQHGCGVFVNPSLSEDKTALRIGLWINEVNVTSASNSGLLFSVCRKASELGHNIILGTSADYKSFSDWLKTSKPDGLFLSGMIDNSFMKNVEAAKLPFVVIGNYELKKEFDRIEFDISVLETAICNAIQKYSSLNPALIGGKGSYLISRQIKTHFLNALQEKGLSPNNDLLRFSDNEDGYAEIKYLMENSPVTPDLIFATEQSFLGIARYFFEKDLVNKKAPHLIVSCGQKEKIPYPELVDITIEGEPKGTEKAFDILLSILDGRHDGNPILHKTYAKIIYGKDF